MLEPKRKMPKDTILYDRLGVSPDSTESQVKKAFIHLSKQWHPDKHPEEMKEEASTKFKDITEARDILIDEEKRKMYDQVGMEMFKQQSGGGGGGSGNHPFNPFGSQGFPFGGFQFGNVNMNVNMNQRNVEPIHITLKVTLEQLYKEEKSQFTFSRYNECTSCDGEGGTSDQCNQCRGQGKTVHIQQMGHMITQTVTDCPSCKGKGKIIKNECKNCNGKGTKDLNKTMEVALNGKMFGGARIQIHGEGNRFKGIKSDLIVTLDIPVHPIFKRTGNNLVMKVELSLFEALFGFTKTLRFLDSSPLTIECSTKTDYHTVKCIPGKGITKEGNLCIIFTIEIPTIEKNKYKKMIKDILGVKDEVNDQDPTYLTDVSNPEEIILMFLKN